MENKHDNLLLHLCIQQEGTDENLSLLKNVFTVSYCSSKDPFTHELIEDVMSNVFDNNEQILTFIKMSPIILKKDGLAMVGKYKDWFWSSSEEGKFFYAGKTINELACALNSDFHEIHNQTDFEEFIDYHSDGEINSKEFTEEFKQLCQDFDVPFEFKLVSPDRNELVQFSEETQKMFGFKIYFPFGIGEIE